MAIAAGPRGKGDIPARETHENQPKSSTQKLPRTTRWPESAGSHQAGDAYYVEWPSAELRAIDRLPEKVAPQSPNSFTPASP
jgi:hypothetical protein